MIRRLIRRVGFSRVAGLALLAALVALRIADPVPVERLRLQMFDAYQQINAAPRPALPVAIVDIDDRSLAESGQWPWPRTTIAELTQKAMEAGAIVIAFDIVFSEPDRLSPGNVARDNPALPPQARDALAALPSNDAVLAQTLARARVVLGQTSTRDTGQAASATRDVPEVAHAILGQDPRPFLLNFPELVQNLPVLEEAAAGRGVFTVLPDPDGVYRRVPAVVSVEGRYRLTITLEALRLATGGNAFAIRTNEAGVEGVVVGGKLIRTESDGTIWNNFGPSDPARFVGASDLLMDRLPEGRLAGHLLLVGTSAIGLEDFRPTPLGVSMAGVEIHAQLLENVLNDTLLYRPNYAIGMELASIAVLAAIIIVLAPILSAKWLILTTLGMVGGYVGLSYYLFVNDRALVDPSFPVLVTIATAMLMSSINYIREEMQRQQIRNAFGQYVSPDLVSQLAENPDQLKLGGERRDLSVLFMDVRGFTAISEAFRDNPTGLTQLMNRFLTILSQAILDRNGTIDKYMGDAIMAFWNAPVDDPDHARKSCDAALGMLAAIRRFNDTERLESVVSKGVKWPAIDIGIGINTGPCVVGNLGSDKRFDYSALGDAVNLASRLEGQTKAYGVQAIVGDTTRATAAEHFAFLELDLIRVKGKQMAERIHALVGDKTLRDGSAFRALQDETVAMLALYRAQDWDGARKRLWAMTGLATAAGIDLSGVIGLYRARIDGYEAAPPPADWDGVFEATEK